MYRILREFGGLSSSFSHAIIISGVIILLTIPVDRNQGGIRGEDVVFVITLRIALLPSKCVAR